MLRGRLSHLVAAGLLAVACGSGDSGAHGGNGGSPWAPTTHPFDPDCGSCVEIGKGELAHAGNSRVLVDMTTDDPPAQWGRCLFSIMQCLDAGGDSISGCVNKGACPDACKKAFNARLGGSTQADVEVGAVDKVFFDDGALCASPDEQVTP